MFDRKEYMRKYNKCASCGLELGKGKRCLTLIQNIPTEISESGLIRFVFCSVECLQAWRAWQAKIGQALEMALDR
jgi:hypothetical protein